MKDDDNKLKYVTSQNNEILINENNIDLEIKSNNNIYDAFKFNNLILF